MVTIVLNSYQEDKEKFQLAYGSLLKLEGEHQIILSTVEGDACINWVDCETVTVPKQEKSPSGSFKQLNNALPHIKGTHFWFASSNDFYLAEKTKKELEVEKPITYSYFQPYRNMMVPLKVPDLGTYEIERHLAGNFVPDFALVEKWLLDKYGSFDLK